MEMMLMGSLEVEALEVSNSFYLWVDGSYILVSRGARPVQQIQLLGKKTFILPLFLPNTCCQTPDSAAFLLVLDSDVSTS